MNSMKITKLIGIALIVSLIIVAVPASPALGWYDMNLSSTSGQIGDTIIIYGSAFNATEDPAQGVALYFSNDEASIGDAIGTEVTVYKTIGSGITTGTTGTFTESFTVPSKFNDNSNVISGTHYIYACQPSSSPTIDGKVTFTVVANGEISIDPEEGIVGTEVEINGESFAADEEITIEFDSDEIDIEDGDDETDNDGDFTSYIIIPESTAGAQDIDVTVNGYTVTAEFTVEPDIVISPQSGKAGDYIGISGTGFAGRDYIVVYFANYDYAQSIRTDTNGSFYISSFEIPDLELSQGTYNIEVEDEAENLARAPFTLNVVTPTTTPPTTTPPTTTPPPDETDLNISFDTNHVGSSIAIGGSGFTPNGTALILFDEVQITTKTIEPNGSFLVSIKVPPAAGGPHTIKVTDGVITSQATYNIETTPPSPPAPKEPSMGSRIKSPVEFDWDDVEDVSEPVTYTLQISSDSSFGESSLVLTKSLLEDSEYLLTEQEELALAAKETPYYWRVNAVDAASNASSWSGTGEFYISPPFSFPTWAIVVLSIVGALLFFGLGYWLGRRTAFFY